MPGRNDPNPELVIISGITEDSVFNCANYLREMEENYIEELIERGIYCPHQPESIQNETVNKSHQQMEITGAPWQLDSMEQFPAMGAASSVKTTLPSTQPVASAGVWGKRRW